MTKGQWVEKPNTFSLSSMLLMAALNALEVAATSMDLRSTTTRLPSLQPRYSSRPSGDTLAVKMSWAVSSLRKWNELPL